MTMGEIAFYEARNLWNREKIASRRCTLILIKQPEIYAELVFDHLPTVTRDALIREWEKQNIRQEGT